MEIPFIYGKIADGDNFTDRELEKERLYNNFCGLVNTVIISPRRWGKTSLVNMVLSRFKDSDDVLTCQIDIFNCRTEEQFYSAYANTILKTAASGWENFMSAARKYLGRLLPTVTLADIAQTYELSFGLNFKENRLTYDEILDLPDKICRESNKKMIICIDEFQHIQNYEEPLEFQKKLRSHWQRHTKTCYCLYGSKRHMLLDIFSGYDMPFYKFGDIMFLEKIGRKKWTDFIMTRFEASGKHISEEHSGMIADLMKNHPYYTQQLSQQVWLRTETAANGETVRNAFYDIIGQLSLLFANIIDTLTERQINFLMAIADGVRQFSSGAVLSKYNLGTSANIKSLKKAMLQKDLIDIQPGKNIEIQDPVFEYWLKHIYR